jgi:hypothetical protein
MNFFPVSLKENVIASKAWQSHVSVIARNKVTWQSHKKDIFISVLILFHLLRLPRFARNDILIFCNDILILCIVSKSYAND